MRDLLHRDTYNKEAFGLVTPMLSPLHQLITSYEEYLTRMSVVDDIQTEHIIGILLNRDHIQRELSDKANITAADLEKLVNLDQCLKQEATAINNTVALERLRLSYKPRVERWWWWLDEHLKGQADTVDTFEHAIAQISSEAFLTTTVKALLARDDIQRSIQNNHIEPSKLLQLATLDKVLKKKVRDNYESQSPKKKRAIVNMLEKVRNTLRPDTDAWWWFPRLPTSWLDYFDPLWSTLTLIWLAGTFGLLTDIATRFLGSGGPGTFGSIAIIVQSFLALLGGSAVTRRGQAIIERMLTKWNMPKRFRQRIIFGGATALLIL